MVYSVCGEELDRLKSFYHVISLDPVVIPGCSELPEASNLDLPECWQPIVIPNFADLGSKWICYVLIHVCADVLFTQHKGCTL